MAGLALAVAGVLAQIALFPGLVLTCGLVELPAAILCALAYAQRRPQLARYALFLAALLSALGLLALLLAAASGSRSTGAAIGAIGGGLLALGSGITAVGSWLLHSAFRWPTPR